MIPCPNFRTTFGGGSKSVISLESHTTDEGSTSSREILLYTLETKTRSIVLLTALSLIFNSTVIIQTTPPESWTIRTTFLIRGLLYTTLVHKPLFLTNLTNKCTHFHSSFLTVNSCKSRAILWILLYKRGFVLSTLSPICRLFVWQKN